MDEEFIALVRNHTWDLVPPSTQQSIVGTKWVYKIKCTAQGTIQRYKARLVAKGLSSNP